MDLNLEKVYNPKETEDKIYNFWLKSNYFQAKIDKNKKPYTIVMPPPNITGQLHMGHALNLTLQDIIIRFKRMQGYSALFLPGTDHASIATEVKIVEELNQENLSKKDIGREKFLQRAWKWKEKYGNYITNQVKKLGVSCDWSREKFTLDETCSEAVKKVFVKFYNKKLIYRGERIINWCPCCKTSVSDLEVNFTEKEGNLWYIKYYFSDEKDKYLTLATTRPETLLGDTAIAVNPEDERYKNLINKKVIVPIINREIPVIFDNYVEKDFGTGVVKITPAHDMNDFEVGLRHDLPVINILNENAVLNENAGEYSGLSVLEARKKIIEKLKKENYLEKTEIITHNVGTCQRCSSVIEPRVSEQWFLKMQELAEPAVKCVKNKEVKFIPERFEKIYFNWLKNIKDWCISRQLWWGHRIPAFYCQDCKEISVSSEDIKTCLKCSSHNIKQDEDVLDTWFSSALWPFSVLGWPEDTPDFNYFYPTNTLVTGYDIIFFWIARMIFSALEHTGQVPFKNIFINGIVRDEQGRKMSKSLNNGINPLEVIEKYGADALRFTLATSGSPGNDMRFSYEKVTSSRNFANKIWNACRFVLLNVRNIELKNELPERLNLEDKWILNSFNFLIKKITENLEKFEISLAAQKIYEFTWDKFCDWYIEFIKIRLQAESEFKKETCQVLVWLVKNILKILHAFMPFITEEIYSFFTEEALITSKFPEFNEKLIFKDSCEKLENIIEIIRKIRNRRAEMSIPPCKKTCIYISCEDFNYLNILEKNKIFFIKLAYASEVILDNNYNNLKSLKVINNKIKVQIPLDELIDYRAEIERLKKELKKNKEQLDLNINKLNNKNFFEKAPENVVNKVKIEAEKLKEKQEKIIFEIKKIENEIN